MIQLTSSSSRPSPRPRKVGILGHEVFPIGFGGGGLSGEGGGYGFGPLSEKEAIDLLHAAFEVGINVYDLAPIYGYGLAEKRCGKAFKDLGQREKVAFISKGGVSWHPNGRVNMTNEPAVLEKMLGQSLLDLQTDYIDYYFIHWPDPKIDIRRPMEVLSKAKREGKIRYIGLSNTFKDDLIKAMEIDRVDVVQNELNLFQNRVVKDLFPFIDDNGIGFMSWGTLDKGILSGQVRDSKRRFHPLDVRSFAPWWKKEKALREMKFDVMERFRPFLAEYGVTELEFALSYNLNFSSLSCALCGLRTKEQLRGITLALNNLPDEANFQVLLRYFEKLMFENLKNEVK